MILSRDLVGFCLDRGLYCFSLQSTSHRHRTGLRFGAKETKVRGIGNTGKIAMSIDSISFRDGETGDWDVVQEPKVEVTVVKREPKRPESQQENWMEPTHQFIFGLCFRSQSIPSNRSQGILTMPKVLNSEWSPFSH